LRERHEARAPTTGTRREVRLLDLLRLRRAEIVPALGVHGHQTPTRCCVCDATISAYVGHVFRSSLCVPSPTSSPPSRTRMRSALMIVETRCATTSTVALRVYGASAL